jgi:hypothetical protein
MKAYRGVKLCRTLRIRNLLLQEWMEIRSQLRAATDLLPGKTLQVLTGWVGLSVILPSMEKRNFSAPTENRTAIPRSLSLFIILVGT